MKNTLLSLALLSCSAFHLTAESVPHIPAEGFVVPDGFEVSVWATSPMFYNPTNMDVDHLGRMWVAEGRNYRNFKEVNGNSAAVEGGDRIMVLTDSDGDGAADQSHVFVQDPELSAPLGVAVIDNQVVVSQPPSLLVYTDMNRDAVFDPAEDKKEALLTGFGGKDHDHSLHAVTAGPSGQWYFNTGNAGTHIVTDKDGWTLRVGSVYKGGSPSVTAKGPNQGGQPGLVSDDGHVYVGSAVLRVNPDGTGLRVVGHNMRNSYEETVNSYGDVFQNDNDDPPACRTTWLMEYGNLGFASDDGARKWQMERRPGQPAQIAEWRQEDPGTIPAGDVYGMGSPTGICFYENGALGEDWQNLLLSCEAARNVVFGYFPKPDRSGFALERFDFFRSKTREELKAEGIELEVNAANFRPSDVTVGADGAVYIADWYDAGVGGHRTQDETCGGTIYRVTRKGENPRPEALNLDTPEGQLSALKSPANNVRNLGFTRLKAGGSLPEVKKLLAEDAPYFQARGIWLLAQLGEEGVAQVMKVLETSHDPQVRITCYRALKFIDHEVISLGKKLAADPSPAVRREVALAMRERSWEECGEILQTIASQYDGEDKWYLEAIGTGATGKELELYKHVTEGAGNPVSWSKQVSRIAWRLHPNSSANNFKVRALSPDLSLLMRKEAMTAIGFIPTKGAALAMVEIAEKGSPDIQETARFWLHNRSSHAWKDYAGEMKGLNKKQNVVYAQSDYLAPITGAKISNPTVEEVLALTGDAEKGKMGIARCYMCHQVNGQGVDFGPPLDTWGLGHSEEAIASAIIHPNAGIAHGYEASEVVTKDGHTIQGFSLFSGASKIMKVMGGTEVHVKNGQTKSMVTLDKSLMMSAGQMGMSAQDVADVVAYLKVNAQKQSEPKPVSVTDKEVSSLEFDWNLGGKENDKMKIDFSISGGGIRSGEGVITRQNIEFLLAGTARAAREKYAITVPQPYQLGKDGRDMQHAPKPNWGDDPSKKKILFIAGHTTHRHGFHEYRAGSILLANALNASGLPVIAQVHYFELPEDLSIMEDVDTIVFYADGGAKLGENHAFVDKLVKKGVNVMFMHYAVHPEVENGEQYYKPWIGGYFHNDLSVNPTWIADLIPKEGHPVSHGLGDPVKVFDELYWNISLMPESPHHYALAQATPTTDNMVRYGSSKFWNKDAADKLGTPQSLIWCHDPAEGARGAGFTGGHFHSNWAVDNYRKLILNTIAWVSRVDVPADGVPSSPITQEELNLNLNRPNHADTIPLPSPDLLTQPAGKQPKLKEHGRAAELRKKK